MAVTCATGGEELIAMTERCIKGMRDSEPEDDVVQMSCVWQGTDRKVKDWQALHSYRPKNVGFAYGMNLAIDLGVKYYGEPDWVLCFNSDLEYPHEGWLENLMVIARKSSNRILVPSTDSTAIRVQPHAIDKPSFPVEEMSAYCWLVPFKWCQFLKQRYGFWLFDEDFAPAYGEDNWTAYLFAKEFGAKPFRYVPRSFVKHLRARTSRTVKHDRKASSALLVKKLKHELETYTLSAHLKLRAKNLIKVLTP